MCMTQQHAIEVRFTLRMHSRSLVASRLQRGIPRLIGIQRFRVNNVSLGKHSRILGGIKAVVCRKKSENQYRLMEHWAEARMEKSTQE